MDALRDGFVPGSYTALRTLVALAVGALVVLAAGRALQRRAPGLAAGAGLVLLAVAVLRPLADAAALLSPGLPGLRLWLVVLLLALGLAAGGAASRSGRPGLEVAAVVLAGLPVLAPFDAPGSQGYVSFGAPAPAWLGDGRAALTAVLVAGALLALRPGVRSAALAVVGLLVLAAADALLGSHALHAVVAGLALGLLLPALVRSARAVEPSSAGLLAGVALVLAVVTADAGLAEEQAFASAEPGLQVVSDEAYSSLLELVLDGGSRLLPSLQPGPTTTETIRIAG